MAEVNKSSLKSALLEAKEIEKAATEEAKKLLESTLNPRLEQIVQETIKGLENEKNIKDNSVKENTTTKNKEEKTMAENIKVNVGNTEVAVSTENGTTSVELKTD